MGLAVGAVEMTHNVGNWLGKVAVDVPIGGDWHATLWFAFGLCVVSALLVAPCFWLLGHAKSAVGAPQPLQAPLQLMVAAFRPCQNPCSAYQPPGSLKCERSATRRRGCGSALGCGRCMELGWSADGQGGTQMGQDGHI